MNSIDRIATGESFRVTAERLRADVLEYERKFGCLTDEDHDWRNCREQVLGSGYLDQECRKCGRMRSVSGGGE